MATVSTANTTPGAPSAADSSKTSLDVVVRKSSDRGGAHHGWLNTAHTFSFASFYDSKFAQYHSLRVINEDRVMGGEGFGTHPHSNAEIFSYVVSGSILHEDSMKHKEIIKRGDVQFTSAGRGLMHSEYNASPTDLVHFLQIWVRPQALNLQPSYATAHFTDAKKQGRLCPIVTPDGVDGSIKINQDIKVYACILKAGESVSHTSSAGRAMYLHLIQDVTGFTTERGTTALALNDSKQTKLNGGDGVFVHNARDLNGAVLTMTGAGSGAEFLLFDIRKQTPTTASVSDPDED